MASSASAFCSSVSSLRDCDWTSATSFFLSLLESTAASITVLNDCNSALKFEVSTCMSAGFLAISRSRMPMARSIVSTVSTSSFSAARKSAFSFSRIRVAFLRSPSSEAMDAARSSILEVEASMSPEHFAMVASSFAFAVFAVSISYARFLVASSHHSIYSLGLCLHLALLDDLRLQACEELDDFAQGVGSRRLPHRQRGGGGKEQERCAHCHALSGRAQVRRGSK